MLYEVRRASDGQFYIVSIDENNNSIELYLEGKLIKFESSEEAKEYIQNISPAIETTKKKRRLF